MHAFVPPMRSILFARPRESTLTHTDIKQGQPAAVACSKRLHLPHNSPLPGSRFQQTGDQTDLHALSPGSVGSQTHAVVCNMRPTGFWTPKAVAQVA
jgi:hypothetical protein